MYQVLARKLRPQNFDQLVGQQQVARTLANAIQSDRLAHAYIFAGLRGIGKTTVARILAKCLNCEQGPTIQPCGTCAACEEIAEGRSIDVLEIDAASRTGVDNIRELQEVVSYAPVRDRFKILIIDEAHMLSKAAFNALLKTLEEPPRGVVFVLATTELQKILPTILSRCQVFEFKRVSAKDVSAYLEQICRGEGVTISSKILERIARAGEGSVRDSLSVLERVLAFCGREVGDDDALQVLGAVGTAVLIEMTAALAARDAASMLGVLDRLIGEGHDLLHFWGELVAVLRDLLMTRAVPDSVELLSRPPEECSALEAAAEGLSREDLLRAFQMLADSEILLKTSSEPRFVFEALLIRLADLGAVRPIEELLAGMTGTAGGGASAPRRPQPRPAPKKKAVEPPVARPEPDSPPTGDFVERFQDAVQAAKPMLAAMLDEATVGLDGDTLTLTFDEAAQALRKRLGDADAQAVLKQAAADAAGRPVKLSVTSGSPAAEPPRAETPAPVARPRQPAPTADGPRPAPAKEAPGDPLLQQATNEPGVKKLLFEFGAQVVEIEPLARPGDAKPGPMEDSR